jgi:hypothetical protein
LGIAPLDAELNSAHNPSGFRNNPNRIANPDKKKPNLVLTLPTYNKDRFFLMKGK